MIKFAIADLPEGFELLGSGANRTVAFEGASIAVSVVGSDLCLFTNRSYKHRLLAKHLGLAVADD